jgi:hypothetical protein
MVAGDEALRRAGFAYLLEFTSVDVNAVEPPRLSALGNSGESTLLLPLICGFVATAVAG